ncbi:hypothetical protein DRQ25_17900, partial [Candidatus Fermentibacteria bacterium]
MRRASKGAKNYAQSAFNSAIIIFIAASLGTIFGYLFRLVLARNLTQEEFGLFYAVLAFFSLFAIFQNLGLNQALVKKIAELNAKGRAKEIPGLFRIILSFQTLSSFVASAIFFFAADIIATAFFHAPEAAPVIRVLTLFFFLSTLYGILLSVLQGYQHLAAYAGWELARWIAFFIFLVIGLAVTGRHDPLIPAWSYIAGFTLLMIPLLVFTRSRLPKIFAIPARYDMAIAKGALVFGLSIMLSSVANAIMGFTDTLMLSYFSTIIHVAYYNVSIPITKAFLGFAVAISTVMLPLSSEMKARKANESLRKGIGTLYLYVLAVSLPLAFLFITYAPLILFVLFGRDYIAA